MGDAFNDKFVFVNRLTSHPESRMLENIYSAGGHPSFIYINAKGEEVSRVVGASSDMDKFIATMTKYGTEEYYFANILRKAKKDKSFIDEFIAILTDTHQRDKLDIALDLKFQTLNSDSEKLDYIKDVYYAKYQSFYNCLVSSSIVEYVIANKTKVASHMNVEESVLNGHLNSMVDKCMYSMIESVTYDKAEIKAINTLADKGAIKRDTRFDFMLSFVKYASKNSKEKVFQYFYDNIDTFTNKDRLMILSANSHLAASIDIVKKCIEKSLEMETYSHYKNSYKRMLK